MKVRREVGEVTLLINNAGIANVNGILNMSDNHIDKCLQVNTTAHFWVRKIVLTKPVCPYPIF